MTLAVHNVSFGYRKNWVLTDVSLTVEPGRLHALLGPNGSGKSTLSKVITGVHRPARGHVSWQGEDLRRLDRNTRAKLLAYVPQSVSQSFELTVREAVLLGRTPHFSYRPSTEDWTIVDRAIEDLGLGELASRDTAALSGGQAQRVGIARAIAQQSKALLLDEPTSALDLRYQVQTLEKIRELTRNRGVGALVAIHDLTLAAAFSDTVTLLDRGRVFSTGRPAEVLTEAAIERVYGLEVEVFDRRGRLHIDPVLSERSSAATAA
ncbi:ABC transporter ATP-binding protein [Agromyces intestinalis]|uniref:ABC transporter ATP-binding protein n=1 Tax=Agromyces intestinalis TaxID=2592652 RepID=A0A5C1YHZ2_9MICO|nr:ABC transporter ATP-binding protein [Agromyces intestinalis]QEO14392.1 ABC transporter ATP-binding protein [Agromyces intestinalis]